ncbi:hypothetical protein CYD30_12500 [Kosakonia cowanii]|nr:hypothetical protein CYD30_12500 [Kosakonia cowanii]
MQGLAGFWDIEKRYTQLSDAGDPLEKLNSVGAVGSVRQTAGQRPEVVGWFQGGGGLPMTQ